MSAACDAAPALSPPRGRGSPPPPMSAVPPVSLPVGGAVVESEDGPWKQLVRRALALDPVVAREVEQVRLLGEAVGEDGAVVEAVAL